MEKRRDEMDYFALGGIPINEEDLDELFAKHKGFCGAYGIDCPLHSWAITEQNPEAKIEDSGCSSSASGGQGFDRLRSIAEK
ncbi:hypothetical protein NKH82_32810 [Mesorhizobium sp. M0915]|uniref:hypothetical protein n=1 Tax=Mesorhizobium sp. M0915 TaxID=2957027 RepID=UPI00333A4094